MSGEPDKQGPQKPPAPVCPYCGLDPCVPNMIPVTFGTLVGRIFVCENKDCRKIFNVELIGEKQ